ncbi:MULTISPECIES: GIY-YIG nuclease family protein [unclassified Nostoc]|uniref:GIY-YIG nuclease family protein n=1 Tax=unclassified Nostoc TaxID=2593658 RepID=UPI0021AB6E7D|nr:MULTISPECIES: GIY-YIG nuclease family protein [unclassified Nostoc]
MTLMKKNQLAKFYVYLACCANGTLYVGYSQNVEKRIAAHNAGRGGRYTRINRPLTLVATWSFTSRAEAIRMERSLKHLSPEQKLVLASKQTAVSLSNVL